MAHDACPIGHPVRDPWALRCPTCGRLMPRRFARVCPNGHVVSGPLRVCPMCGETVGVRWPVYAVGVVGVAALVVLILVARSADLPGRVAATIQELYTLADEFIHSLPFFTT